jgi:hypothetical protein
MPRPTVGPSPLLSLSVASGLIGSAVSCLPDIVDGGELAAEAKTAANR